MAYPGFVYTLSAENQQEAIQTMEFKRIHKTLTTLTTLRSKFEIERIDHAAS